jgi:hypothetical protein
VFYSPTAVKRLRECQKGGYLARSGLAALVRLARAGNTAAGLVRSGRGTIALAVRMGNIAESRLVLPGPLDEGGVGVCVHNFQPSGVGFGPRWMVLAFRNAVFSSSTIL